MFAPRCFRVFHTILPTRWERGTSDGYSRVLTFPPRYVMIPRAAVWQLQITGVSASRRVAFSWSNHSHHLMLNTRGGRRKGKKKKSRLCIRPFLVPGSFQRNTKPPVVLDTRCSVRRRYHFKEPERKGTTTNTIAVLYCRELERETRTEGNHVRTWICHS